ncbi:DUF1559 domain-containing protein [Singulisphaera sp. Ch08]|uniref:DUF1559 domain-containing protein n=1 Tax=Singulisphaera sp. Ch08 TaxID=3120278 RepID=A0AAU7CNG1_9BACT
MAILVLCDCGKQFQTREEYAGRRARCSACGREFNLPHAAVALYSPPSWELNAEDAFATSVPQPERNSEHAITSLVLGLLGLASICGGPLIVLSPFLGIWAIIYGWKGWREIQSSRGHIRGAGMATTGIVAGMFECSLVLILILLLIPYTGVSRSPEAVHRGRCERNLKQIGQALFLYENIHGGLPHTSIVDSEGKALLSWRVRLLPFLNQGPLYRKFKLDEAWDSPHNRMLLREMPSLYACPSDGLDDAERTRYTLVVGHGALFEANRPVSIDEVTDELRTTLMIVESAAPIPWTKPEDLPFAPNLPPPRIGSHHPGIANALFANGGTRILKKSISPEILRALISRDGGEVISLEDF